jgi:hypothetical protein
MSMSSMGGAVGLGHNVFIQGLLGMRNSSRSVLLNCWVFNIRADKLFESEEYVSWVF